MDGKLLFRELRELLNEASDSTWFDSFTAYNYLYQAATEMASRTNCLRSEATLTTVDGQAGYTLPSDFLQLYLKDSYNRHFVKLYDGSSYTFIPYQDYSEIYYANNTDEQAIPNSFTIIDDTSVDSSISSTTTGNGSSSGGQCTLTDTNANFTDVSAGDNVHNSTDGSFGIVLSKTSTTVLVTALFGGTANDWTVGDSYFIQPQGRYKLVLDPIPSTSGYTVTVPYVQKPAPVFSELGVYRFPFEFGAALVKYAFWLYKYRDGQPNFGDKMFQYFDMQCKRHGAGVSNRLRQMRRFKVNLRAR